MKQVTINLYKFDELSDEAKQVALLELAGINVHYDWWQGTYEYASNIHLKITGFNLDRNKHATGYFEPGYTGIDVAQKILSNQGDKTDTYALAAAYIESHNKLVAKYSDGINTEVVTEENEYDFDNDLKDLEDEFLKDMLEEYSCILQREYEYLASEQAIIDTIEANEYDFTEDGKLY